MSEFSKSYLEELKRSRDQVGCLYPVLVDQEGKIIDGRHRKAVCPDWPETQTEVKTPVQRLQKIMHLHLRREITQAETRENLIKLAVELKKTGTPPGLIVKMIHQLVPYAESYIRMLLPVEFKDFAHVQSALQQDPWNKQGEGVALVTSASPEETPGAQPLAKLKKIVEDFGKLESQITFPFTDCGCSGCSHKKECYG